VQWEKLNVCGVLWRLLEFFDFDEGIAPSVTSDRFT
jgi:hypothetical protein